MNEPGTLEQPRESIQVGANVQGKDQIDHRGICADYESPDTSEELAESERHNGADGPSVANMVDAFSTLSLSDEPNPSTRHNDTIKSTDLGRQATPDSTIIVSKSEQQQESGKPIGSRSHKSPALETASTPSDELKQTIAAKVLMHQAIDKYFACAPFDWQNPMAPKCWASFSGLMKSSTPENVQRIIAFCAAAGHAISGSPGQPSFRQTRAAFQLSHPNTKVFRPVTNATKAQNGGRGSKRVPKKVERNAPHESCESWPAAPLDPPEGLSHEQWESGLKSLAAYTQAQSRRRSRRLRPEDVKRSKTKQVSTPIVTSSKSESLGDVDHAVESGTPKPTSRQAERKKGRETAKSNRKSKNLADNVSSSMSKRGEP